MCVSRNVDTTKERQYLHSNSDGMQYKDVDVLFYGGQLSGRTFPRFAFIYSGLWLERETATYDAIGVVDMSANEVLPMKTPVISAIISRTPSIPDDTVLAQVVDYVDGVTAEKPAGVTDEDIAIIAEARNMVNKGSEDTFLITKMPVILICAKIFCGTSYRIARSRLRRKHAAVFLFCRTVMKRMTKIWDSKCPNLSKRTMN